jgi:hypothetical protein
MTSRNLKAINILIFLAIFVQFGAFGQEREKTKKELKNTIWINIFNPIIDARYVVFGYERVLKNNQTFTFNIGRFALPRFDLIDLDEDLGLTNEYKDWGINTSVDYRFYLGKLNKYSAPRGVYLAPYYSFNHFNRENKWILDTESFDGEVITDFTLNIHTLGGQLGYQFIFWRRLAVDLVLIGPGIGYYGMKVKLGTSLEPDDESLLFQTLNDALKEKFPGYDLVIEPGEFEKKGSASITTLGFRYMIHIGFRF